MKIKRMTEKRKINRHLLLLQLVALLARERCVALNHKILQSCSKKQQQAWRKHVVGAVVMTRIQFLHICRAWLSGPSVSSACSGGMQFVQEWRRIHGRSWMHQKKTFALSAHTASHLGVLLLLLLLLTSMRRMKKSQPRKLEESILWQRKKTMILNWLGVVSHHALQFYICEIWLLNHECDSFSPVCRLSYRTLHQESCIKSFVFCQVPKRNVSVYTSDDILYHIRVAVRMLSCDVLTQFPTYQLCELRPVLETLKIKLLSFQNCDFTVYSSVLKQAGQSQILGEVCGVRATPLFIRQAVQWF